MFSKTRKFNIILIVSIVLLSLLALYICYHFISKSHAQEIKNLKEDNKESINRLNKNHEKDLNIRDNIILDKEGRIMELTENVNNLKWDITKLNSYLEVKNKKTNLAKTIENAPAFTVTAYDLSVQSCGKLITDRAYGITANGKNLTGLDLRTASTISTDKNIIPLGSIVYLYFTEEKSKQFNGLYVSNDTGSAIKGRKIDLFFGDYNSANPDLKTLNFGKQQAKVIFLQ